MVEIRPMGEDYILPDCLHYGPHNATAAPTAESDEPDLPPHPWSDDTIRDYVAGHAENRGLCDAGPGWPTEFMREMIRRYLTCALLAWDGRTVVGLLRFYPMVVARFVAQNWEEGSEPEPILDPRLACDPEDDEGTLWVHCVMTSRPYIGAGHDTPPGSPEFVVGSPEQAGARKGIGLKLAKALIPWARENGWKRIIKVATCDLDFFYGIWGGGGKTLWEKAGFKVIGTIHRPQEWSEEDMTILRAQLADKGMTEEDAWTFYRMAYEL